MKSKQYLQRNLIQTLDKKAPKEILFSGNLGVIIDGETRLSVAGRSGYVYVRLRGNLSELIQAYNSVVSPVYDLPVLVSSSPSTNQYTVIGRDIQKYSNWGETPYLPRHGNQHSFQPETGGGGDVVWVASRQFLPLLVHPSGTYGSAGVYIEPSIYYWEEAWHYAGGTGTPSLLTYKPTDGTAKMLLIYLDSTGNPQYEVGGSFDSSYTGTSQIVNYIPTSISLSDGIPLGAVRLVSGTSAIGWDNIYDLRPYLSPERFVTGSYAGSTHGPEHISSGDDPIPLAISSGTSGLLSGADKSTLDNLATTYLKIDASNDPISNDLEIDGDLILKTVGDGIRIKEGTNATMGQITLSSGTATVSTTQVTNNSRIFLTTNGGTISNLGILYISARTANTSFVISSTNVLDACAVAWLLLEPSP